MELFYLNFGWIWINVGLAFIGLALALLFGKLTQLYAKILCFVFYVLFVPNTIYLVTDLQYLPGQLAKTPVVNEQLLLLTQFIIVAAIGVFTFFVSLFQLQHYLISKAHRKHRIFIFTLIAILNYFIAFAVVLGKIERTNSWYVFTDPERVVRDVLAVFNSDTLLLSIVVAGSLINLLYFTMRKLVLHLKSS